MTPKLGDLHESTPIMILLGRWKSISVFDYIQKQVAEFSIDVFDAFLFSCETFFSTPDFRRTPSQYPSHIRENIDGGIDWWGILEPICFPSTPEKIDGGRRGPGQSVRC